MTALGLALAHFLWEGGLIGMALAAVLYLVRPRSARVRYGLAAAALFAMPAAFAVTLVLLLPGHYAGTGLRFAIDRVPELGAGSGSWNAAARRDAYWWAGAVWMAGVAVFYLRAFGGWMAARQLRRKGVCAAPQVWTERLDALRARLRVARAVALVESCRIDVPAVIGWLRPVILVPAGLLAGLPAEQLEGILAHELAHIRRHDYLVNLLQSLVEGLLFYHPAVWWVSSVVRAERENCCDDIAVAVSGDARGYAAALANLEESRWAAREVALAASGGNLMKRIRRLLEQNEGPRPAGAAVLGAAVLMVSLGVALFGWQSKPNAAPVQTDRYQKWLKQDVVYIINDRERAAFENLQTDAEREKFIEQFWERRNPTPGSAENPFKKEHYRRIGYANEHFREVAALPGWKTDRGRVYIMYGPPDEIESHPAGDAATGKPPYEQWLYRHIEGVGNNVIIEFDDADGTGMYRMTRDPHGKR